MVEIIQKENKILRLISKDIPVSEISKPKIQTILSNMHEALDSQEDGVAIAAPQIGVSLRIFILSKKIFEYTNNYDKDKIYSNMVFINPIILEISKDKKIMEEGCLSVRPIYGKVRRATRATIEAYNEKGEKFTMQGSGILAQAFQHETDHLEGILFIDKATNLIEVS
jgi:peptide deformylase